MKPTPVLRTIIIAMIACLAQGADKDLSVSITGPECAKIGSHLQIRITVTNVSSHDITIQGNMPALVYDLDVRDRDGKQVAETQHYRRIKGKEEASTGPAFMSMIIVTLKPGEKYEETLPIHKLFDLKKPGKYTIQLDRSGVKSNILAFTIVD